MIDTPESQSFRPLFTADWLEAVFLHYRVPAAALQPAVPFPLDLTEDAAWVSLVAFTMHRLRPAGGGRLGERLFGPLSPCRFLNVRTYVRSGGEPGIYFLAEWISNPLSVPLGPVSFGLPYHRGRLAYRHSAEDGLFAGAVAPAKGSGSLQYRATPAAFSPLQCAVPGTRAEFLIERYSAFTCWAGWRRRFRIRHEPWALLPLRATVEDHGLLARVGAWSHEAELMEAHYSPGVREVQISWPSAARA